MPSPVGPPPADPNDPDLWDWGDPDKPAQRARPNRARHAAIVLVSIFVVVALISFVIR